MGTTNRLPARGKRDGIEPFTPRDASLEIDRLTVQTEANAEVIRTLRAERDCAVEEANALRWQLGEVKDEAFNAAEKSNTEFWESVEDDATAF